MRLWKVVTKVTNPILDFGFLSATKSCQSRIKNPFWICWKEHTHLFGVVFQLWIRLFTDLGKKEDSAIEFQKVKKF